MMKKLLLCLALLLMCAALLPTACAQAEEIVDIVTPEALIELLNTPLSKANDTIGKRYVLQSDMTIQTSDLPTEFSSQYTHAKRQFRGVLDGNGHTLTVSCKTNPAMPLFDSLLGNSMTQYAGVENLKIIFDGDVCGTTIAAAAGNAHMENLSITVHGDIGFAPMQFSVSGDFMLATGLFGLMHDSGNIVARNFQIDAHTIGSTQETPHTPYVAAAGVYSEFFLAGSSIILDGVDVRVEEICAKSAYTGTAYGSVCAAGIASGTSQSNLRLGNARVYVARDIRAESVGHSTANADAYGVAYKLLSLYQTHVEVGGSIEAKGNVYASRNSYDDMISAAGIANNLLPKYNQDVFQATDTGVCSVKVNGDIRAIVSGSNGNGIRAIAAGCAVSTQQEALPLSNISIQVQGNIQAHASDTSNAIATGFVYQPHPYRSAGDGKVDFSNCHVQAGNILSSADKGGAYASGFALWGYGNFARCDVQSGRIEAKGEEATAVGFAYSFAPNTKYHKNKGFMDGCIVKATHIAATHTHPAYTAQAAGLVCATGEHTFHGEYDDFETRGEIINCTVHIDQTLKSSGAYIDCGLFIGNNQKDFVAHDNTVFLPRDQANIITLGNEQFIRFTASEAHGRAGTSADDTLWESGNRVGFHGEQKSNEIFCRYDNSSANGTLWMLPIQSYTVTYIADGVIIDTQTVLHGADAIPPEIPIKEGFTLIAPYWEHDGRNITSDITINAVYTANPPMPSLPQTGDPSSLALWVCLLGLSAVGVSRVRRS